MKIHTRIHQTHINNFHSAFERRNYTRFISPVRDEAASVADFMRTQDNTSSDRNPEPGLVELDKASMASWMSKERKRDVGFASEQDFVTGAVDFRNGKIQMRARTQGISHHGHHYDVDPNMSITTTDSETLFETKNGHVREDHLTGNVDFMVPDNFKHGDANWKHHNKPYVSRPVHRAHWEPRGNFSKERFLMEKYTDPTAREILQIKEKVGKTLEDFRKLEQMGGHEPAPGLIVGYGGNLRTSGDRIDMVREDFGSGVEAYRETPSQRMWRKGTKLVTEDKGTGDLHLSEMGLYIRKNPQNQMFDDGNFDILSWHDGLDRLETFPENKPIPEKKRGFFSGIFA